MRAFVLLSAVLYVLGLEPAAAHSWYPLQCCSGSDCAPVRSIRSVPGGKYVTSDQGTVFVPEGYAKMASMDNEAHVCMRPDLFRPDEMHLICFFEPANS